MQVDINVFMGSGDAIAAPLLRDAAALGITDIATKVPLDACQLRHRRLIPRALKHRSPVCLALLPMVFPRAPLVSMT